MPPASQGLALAICGVSRDTDCIHICRAAKAALKAVQTRMYPRKKIVVQGMNDWPG